MSAMLMLLKGANHTGACVVALGSVLSADAAISCCNCATSIIWLFISAGALDTPATPACCGVAFVESIALVVVAAAAVVVAAAAAVVAATTVVVAAAATVVVAAAIVSAPLDVLSCVITVELGCVAAINAYTCCN